CIALSALGDLAPLRAAGETAELVHERHALTLAGGVRRGFIALQMTWGAVNELTMGLALLEDLLDQALERTRALLFSARLGP
ncbi:MAG: hypothetical protein LC790_08065, partial [Actinobacteria bacterium]|nr:hypothetical protein [Actinomycetota bacterium]